MRVGIVDLDTSHPVSWFPIEKEIGLDIVGVWDGGAVHPASFVEEFAKERDIPRVFGSLSEMVGEVDCAIIHACDWDTHIDKARPFVEAGKSVLLDKPVAGNLRDLNQLCDWAKAGARISGGSSLRFCLETSEFLAKPVVDRGAPDTAMCGCGVDDFNYGIHAYSLLSGLMGPGIKSVRHLGKSSQRRVQVNWDDGRMGFLVVGTPATGGWMPFHASVVTDKLSHQFQADNATLYRALLEAVVPYLSGETDEPPIPMDVLIEPELCALAALKSWTEGDREVKVSELSPQDAGFDGAAFAVGYRKARYPNG